MTETNFYGTNTVVPQSVVLDNPTWHGSPLDKYNQLTAGAIYLRKIPTYAHEAPYIWRVVDLQFTAEDSLITYFRAFGPNDEHLPFAAFGVSWDGCPHRLGQMWEFTYAPEFGDRYYQPVENKFQTNEAGGYTVQVLHRDYPSEALNFGVYKQDNRHMCLVISFKLFARMPGYPNDGQYYEGSE